jgi:hypothetical protein
MSLSPSLLAKLKQLARLLGECSPELQAASEELVGAWLHILKTKKSFESVELRVSLGDALARLFSQGRKRH